MAVSFATPDSTRQPNSSKNTPIIHSLRTKIILIGGLTLLSLLLISSLLLQEFMLRGFTGLEKLAVQQNLQRVEQVLGDALGMTDKNTRGWSSFDATYDYMVNPTQEYIDANLADNFIGQYNINVLGLIDSSGRLIYSKAYDPIKTVSGPLPPELIQFIAKHLEFTQFAQGEADHHTGIIMMPQGPLMVSFRQVLPTSEVGPSHGTFFTGTYLSSEVVKQLNTASLLSFTINDLQDSTLPPNDQTAAQMLLTTKQPVVQPLDDTTVVGYSVLNDILGEPKLMVRLPSARDIYSQGRQQVLYVVVAIAFGGLLIGGVMLALLEGFVLRRLIGLVRRFTEIGEHGNLTERVPVVGHDEIAQLSHTINSTLHVLEHTQTERQRSEEERIQTLEDKNIQQRALLAQLEASIAERSELSRTLQDLSSPIIPVLAGTLVIPLIGNIGEQRAKDLIENVLRSVEQQHSRHVVVDLTGVQVLDTAVSQHIVQLSQSLRLLGAETILVGIRPEVAQTLVTLGIDLSAQSVAANLQSAVSMLAARGRN